MPAPRSVADYLAAQPEAARDVLEQVRALIRRAAPRAVERIAYGMPAFELEGRPLLYFAGWKKHYSLYPVTPELLATLDEGADHDVEKGTVRFLLDAPVPSKLIARIAKRRASEVRAEARVKSLSSARPTKKPTEKSPTKKKPAKKP